MVPERDMEKATKQKHRQQMMWDEWEHAHSLCPAGMRSQGVELAVGWGRSRGTSRGPKGAQAVLWKTSLPPGHVLMLKEDSTKACFLPGG